MANQNTVNESLKKLIKLLWIEKRELKEIYLYAIVAGLTGTFFPLLLQSVLNFVQSGILTSSLFIMLALLLSVLVLNSYFQVKQMSYSERLQQKLFARATLYFASALPNDRTLSDKEDERYHPIYFLEIILLQKGIGKILIDFTYALTQIIVCLALLSFYHPIFLGGGFILFSLTFLFLLYNSKSSYLTAYNESKYKYHVFYSLIELGIFKNYFKSKFNFLNKLGKLDADGQNYIQFRSNHFNKIMSNAKVLFGFKIGITALLLISGAYLFIEQKITLGQFIASEIVIILISSSVDKLIATQETFYDALVSATKIEVIQQYAKKAENPHVIHEELYQTKGFESVEIGFLGDETQNLIIFKGDKFDVLSHIEPVKIKILKLNDMDGNNFSDEFLNDRIQVVYPAYYFTNKIAILNAYNRILRIPDLRSQLNDLILLNSKIDWLPELLEPVNFSISNEQLFLRYSLMITLSKPEIIVFADRRIKSTKGQWLIDIINKKTEVMALVQFDFQSIKNNDN